MKHFLTIVFLFIGNLTFGQVVNFTSPPPVCLSYTIDLHNGYNLLGNPFINVTTVGALVKPELNHSIPVGSELFGLGGQPKLATLTSTGWDHPNAVLPTGSACFLKVQGVAPNTKLKFLGQPLVGEGWHAWNWQDSSIDIELNAGNNWVVPMFVHADHTLISSLNVPYTDGVIVYIHTATGFDVYAYDPDFGWDPYEPEVKMGTCIGLFFGSPHTWRQPLVCVNEDLLSGSPTGFSISCNPATMSPLLPQTGTLQPQVMNPVLPYRWLDITDLDSILFQDVPAYTRLKHTP